MDSLIRSISDSQDEILKSIMTLYCPDGFDLDPTYSKGVFYKNIKSPRYKSDIKPLSEDVMECDCRDLPFEDGELNSIVFDPPFVAAQPSGRGKNGIIRDRFGYFKNIGQELWGFYKEALLEFYRVLRSGGVLVFKCQDTIDSGQQYLSHVEIVNQAYKIGFYPKDLFILIAKSRLTGKWKQQLHARKFHCYFLVFQKCKSPVRYSI